ncbi:hypothetical protein [Catellatospora vulcania]|uniref:hypothetical protein n=1 Tax=Catellatospora vulcania TaxID=1460450 RepID=UPI0012D42F45|nr:hypothetical protein [Catellatospora vulcania]
MAALLTLTGCGDPSPAEQAEEDATSAVSVAYASMRNNNRIMPAELVGRMAVDRDLEVLEVIGTEAGREEGPGVTLIVRVVGHGADHDFYGMEENAVDLPFCFRLQFTGMHVGHDPELVSCPAKPAIAYPPLPAPASFPAQDAVEEVFAKVPADVAAARQALQRLKVDQRLEIDVAADAAAVGVALRARGPFGERAGCMLIRAERGVVEAWTLSRAQDQPGELGCTAAEALGRQGNRPPH